MHKKTYFCSFNEHLAREHDAEKINEFVSPNCLEKCILFLFNIRYNVGMAASCNVAEDITADLSTQHGRHALPNN